MGPELAPGKLWLWLCPKLKPVEGAELNEVDWKAGAAGPEDRDEKAPPEG